MRACSYCRKLLPPADATCPDDGSPAIEVALRPPAPELAARFRRIEPFAVGATGELWRVVAPQSDRPALLKVFADAVASSLAERTRCKRELRKQATIVQGNLPRVFDEGETAGSLWVLRELAPGESLAVRIRRQGALTVPESLAIAAQLAQALDELHRQGLVHRDVKPGHVILTARGNGLPTARLIDAGIAARLPGDGLLPSFGTAAYAAPEIALGKPASFRSDLYSLGCVLYEMLSGAPPFERESIEAVLAAQRDTEPKRLESELPGQVDALLAALLAKEPRRRPFSAQQVRRALEPHLPGGMPPFEPSARSVAPPPSAATSPAAGYARIAADVESTQDLPFEELVLASPEPALKTQELELSDLETEAAPITKTQELELSDVEPLPLPSHKTQELELSDVEALPPPTPRKTQELDLRDVHSLRAAPSRDAEVAATQRPSVRAAQSPVDAREIEESAATIALPPIVDALPPSAAESIQSAPPPSAAEVNASAPVSVAPVASTNNEGAVASLRKRLATTGRARSSSSERRGAGGRADE
ncbi:MAG TPA: protein kinase [Polyangiales bacterium]|nr:protein kinase [Polyangiales bacterium]